MKPPIPEMSLRQLMEYSKNLPIYEGGLTMMFEGLVLRIERLEEEVEKLKTQKLS